MLKLITQVFIIPGGYITHLCKRLTSAADSRAYASLQAHTADVLTALGRSWSAAWRNAASARVA